MLWPINSMVELKQDIKYNLYLYPVFSSLFFLNHNFTIFLVAFVPVFIVFSAFAKLYFPCNMRLLKQKTGITRLFMSWLCHPAALCHLHVTRCQFFPPSRFSEHNLSVTRCDRDLPDPWFIVSCISGKALSVYEIDSCISFEGDMQCQDRTLDSLQVDWCICAFGSCWVPLCHLVIFLFCYDYI